MPNPNSPNRLNSPDSTPKSSPWDSVASLAQTDWATHRARAEQLKVSTNSTPESPKTLSPNSVNSTSKNPETRQSPTPENPTPNPKTPESPKLDPETPGHPPDSLFNKIKTRATQIATRALSLLPALLQKYHYAKPKTPDSYQPAYKSPADATPDEQALLTAADTYRRFKSPDQTTPDEQALLDATAERDYQLQGRFKSPEDASEDEQALLDSTQLRHQLGQDLQPIKNERAQELTERAFNQRLTTIDQLDDAVALAEPGISKTSTEYNGQEIPVYNLTGYPIRYLQHVVNYRLNPYENNAVMSDQIGSQIAHNLLHDPNTWMQTRDQITLTLHRGAQDLNSAGDAISMSYIDPILNPDSGADAHFQPNQLIYCFNHLNPDSLIDVFYRDGGTNNSAGLQPTQISEYQPPDHLSRHTRTTQYNELLIRRYDEQGNPTKPDFILAYDNKINDFTKQHAAFFNIPIVNLDKSAYRNLINQRATNQLKSIDENTPYTDLINLNADLTTLFNIRPSKIPTILPDNLQEALDKARRYLGNTPQDISAIQNYIENIEPAKRLDFLKDKLQTAVSSGERDSNIYAAHFPSDFHIIPELRNIDYLSCTYCRSFNGASNPYFVDVDIPATDPHYSEFLPLVEEYENLPYS